MRRAVVAVLATVLVACGGERDPSVRVEPASSLADEPVRLTVRDLGKRQSVTLRVQSTDSRGVRWSSSMHVRANEDGRIDLDRGRGMPLIWGMQPEAISSATFYFWNSEKPLRFRALVHVQGRTVASGAFRRRLMRERVVTRLLSVQREGLAGIFFSTKAAKRRPTVLLLGGSNGGIPALADTALLAGRGYPVLALAYFREPGLPQTLSAIPLEYFARALRWLARQPQVDPARIVAWGISRGSEAALLLGVHYPHHVHGVVALVPSNVALCSFPGCEGPAWTLDGRALPFTQEFNEPDPDDEPRAVIPVERIDGPILLVCGRRDAVWNSCAYAEAIEARLEARRHPHAHRLYDYAGAGHALGFLAPYMPAVPDDPAVFDHEQRARAEVWPHVLDFLRELGR